MLWKQIFHSAIFSLLILATVLVVDFIFNGWLMAEEGGWDPLTTIIITLTVAPGFSFFLIHQHARIQATQATLEVERAAKSRPFQTAEEMGATLEPARETERFQAEPEEKEIDADAVFASIEAIIARDPVFLPLGSSRAEPGRISTFLAIEGAGAFAADITQIDRFIARGLRLVSPAHRKNSPLSASATGEKVKYGLTPLGKEFCARVYERGALIDVSHVSDAAFLDIAAIAEAHGAPVVATHSNSRAIADTARNLTDAVFTLRQWKDLEGRPSRPVRDGDALAWMESAAYLKLADQSMKEKVVRPLLERGIVTKEHPL
mgnify:CR=1 FL=1